MCVRSSNVHSADVQSWLLAMGIPSKSCRQYSMQLSSKQYPVVMTWRQEYKQLECLPSCHSTGNDLSKHSSLPKLTPVQLAHQTKILDATMQCAWDSRQLISSIFMYYTPLSHFPLTCSAKIIIILHGWKQLNKLHRYSVLPSISRTN